MNVISLVPSWTETLLECGINVIGRTRFCIHPSEEIEHIPVVGGTKDIDWDKVKNLEPDLVLLDKEENPKAFFDECTFPTFVTHITSIRDVTVALLNLSEKFENQRLFNLAGRWQSISESPQLKIKDLEKFPGLIQWVKRPTHRIKKIQYLIWRDPWMTVSKETFIGSVLLKFGIDKYMNDYEEKYPEINLEDFDPKSTLLLCASEPYPFHKKIEELKKLPFPSMIVNGESYSWFGLRTLMFLETQRELYKPKKPIFSLRSR